MVNLLIPEEEDEERDVLLVVFICTLYLYACQVNRVTVGDSGLCCCACVMSFERQLTPSCVDSINFCPCRVHYMLFLLLRSPSRTFFGSTGM